MRFYYYDYIGEVWSESEKIYKNYKIPSTSIHIFCTDHKNT